MMNKVIIGLGGNVGDVKSTLLKCIQHIENKIGNVFTESSIYETAAWGEEDQAPFLNQVIGIETIYKPIQVLDYCLSIELELGRDRIHGKKWRERIIDIDILFYDDLIINLPKLKIPHPYIQDRNFVLVPLAEISPNYTHPELKKSVIELLKFCGDNMKVKRL